MTIPPIAIRSRMLRVFFDMLHAMVDGTGNLGTRTRYVCRSS